MNHAVDPALRRSAQAWIADDPDEGDRRFLKDLLDAASVGGPAGEDATADLAARFAGRLHFGTAGLRAPVGAGPARLNRAVVRATTAGVAAWLRTETPDAATRGVVVGCDARHRSRDLWEETAAVLAGAGIPALLLAPAQPTPLLAFATRHLGAAAGIMITASHNPAADNGYKLYVGDGAQILPAPADAVEAAIAAVGSLAEIPVATAGDPHIVTVARSVTDAYLDAVAAMAPAPDGAGSLRVVHTAMHGVATGLFDAAVARAGYPPVHHVPAQAAPDPDFPTVAFPNPEEPGAMDLALADARRLGADLVLANDPDGDRLAVAVPDPAAQGGWRVMTGDHLGAVLGAAVLAGEVGPRPAGAAGPGGAAGPSGAAGPGGRVEQRVVASSLVSSTMLAAIAADAGATWVETLTGFKWIARGAVGVAGGRLVFGYEEALGYVVGDAVADKDGIGAALAVLALAAADRVEGRTLLHRVDDLERRYGVHATRQVSRRLPSAPAAATVAAKLRSAPPADLGGVPVLSAEDLSRGGRLPPADAIVLQLEGCRVVVRPSGTEPKIKAYLEARQPPTPDLAAARAGADAVLDRVAAGVAGLLDG